VPVNVERDPFPFADATFDVALFCEVIEHMQMDPLHALAELNRVLKPGGTLVLTTPNAARLENVSALLAGHNVYDSTRNTVPMAAQSRICARRDEDAVRTCGIYGRRKLHRRCA